MAGLAERSWIEEEQIDLESCCTDSGSVTEGPSSKKNDEVSSSGMIKLNEEGNEYVMLKHRFYLSVGTLPQSFSVVSAHRNTHSSPMEKARLETFRIFARAMEAKRGGSANMVRALYGASKDEVHQIMKHGFRVFGMPKDGGLYGYGLHLNSELSVSDSLLSAPADADGLRHLVVCCVTLGSTEVVLSGSGQSGPSSGDFDSGVDNQRYPRKYIVWYPDVKTNILPLYTVAVKLNFHSGSGLQRGPPLKPTTPWMPLTALLYVLTKFLPESTLCLVRRLHTNFFERKITRQQFIFRVRQLAGDRLILSAIGDFQEKRMKRKLRTSNK